MFKSLKNHSIMIDFTSKTFLENMNIFYCKLSVKDFSAVVTVNAFLFQTAGLDFLFCFCFRFSPS